MDKDFPSQIFPCLKSEELNKEPKNILSVNEKEIKLNYKHPIGVFYDEKKKNLKFLTQTNFASNFLKQKSSLLPWRSPNFVKEKQGYDICFDFNPKIGGIKFNKIEQQEELIDEHSKENAQLNELKNEEELKDFYYAVCKSNRAKFFPALFSTGQNGKCIYTSDGIWLTPEEYQSYSGSTAADWRNWIKLIDPYRGSSKEKKKSLNSIKTLVDKKIIKTHQYRCDCSRCSDTDHLLSQNANLLSIFLMNSGEDLVFAHPDLLNPNYFKFSLYKTPVDKLTQKRCLIHKLLQPINKNNFTELESIFYQTKIQLGNPGSRNIVKQFEYRTFDENSYFFLKNYQIAENVKEAFVSMNINDKVVQTHFLSLNDEGSNYLETKLIYEARLKNDFISGISASPMIRGECALVFRNSGDIYLLNEDSVGVRSFIDQDKRSIKIANNLQPLFASESEWKNVSFGAQPRQFIYSDYSQVLSIDARIKTLGNNINKEIFRVPSNYLDPNEIIYRTQVVENDFNCHLITCTKTLLLIDERFTKRPILSWPHYLRSPPVLINNIFLPSENPMSCNDSTNMVFISDTEQVFGHQFSLKLHEAPLSHNFTRKFDSPYDLVSYLPDNYDKRLENHLNYRLKKPIIGLTSLRFKNSFALFQMQFNEDVFYECFEINDQNDSLTSSLNSIKFNNQVLYEKWLEKIKSQVMEKHSVDFDFIFDEMTLDEFDSQDDRLNSAFKWCQLCLGSNAKNLTYLKQKNEICLRCGHTDNLKDQLNFENYTEHKKIFDLDKVDLENDEFTASLYSIWDIDEDEANTIKVEDTEMIKLENSKRYKFSKFP